MTAAPRRPARRRAKSGPKRAAVARPKRARATRAPGRPALRVVPRRAARAPKSFPQTKGASSKQSVMFELMRARAALGGAIQGLTGGSAAKPIAPGKWSVRQIVLHVGHWDREALRAIESALLDRRPEWLGWGAARDAVANREALAALERHDWESAQRLLHSIRAEFLGVVESVPDQPAEVWSREHAFGEMLRSSAEHDRHHADIIKRWRTGRER
jgi:hypothetical protein